MSSRKIPIDERNLKIAETESRISSRLSAYYILAKFCKARRELDTFLCTTRKLTDSPRQSALHTNGYVAVLQILTKRVNCI